MRKETIKFTDYNGNEHEKDYWFNLSKAELATMEMREKKGLEAMLTQIVEEDDRDKILAFFKDIILKSIGEKSEDGLYFYKDAQIARNFEASEAFTELWMKLITDAGYAAEFVTGLIPQALAEEMAKQEAEGKIQPMPLPKNE